MNEAEYAKNQRVEEAKNDDVPWSWRQGTSSVKLYGRSHTARMF
jgi:hypothetical protein